MLTSYMTVDLELLSANGANLITSLTALACESAQRI